MLGVLQWGTTQLQATDGWQHLAVWTRLRNVLTVCYIVLFLHDLLIRVFAYAFLPLMIGFQLPPLPYFDAVLFLLVLLIGWRLVNDPPWRATLYCKQVAFMLAGLLVMLAAGLIHGQALIHLVMLKGLVYPLVVFLIAYCLGINLRKGMQLVAAIGLLNLAAGLIVFLYFLDNYRELLLLLEVLMPETSQGISGVSSRHASVLVPYGLFIRRNMCADFYSITSGISLFLALHPLVSKRWRTIATISFFVGALLVLASFSRTALLSCLLIAVLVVGHRLYQNQRSPDPIVRRHSVVMLLSMVIIGSAALLIAISINVFLEGELFQMSSLTDSEIGRFAYWNRVVLALNSQQGWLLGLNSMSTSGDSMIAGIANEQVWSEHQISTLDNAYLYIIAMTGLVGMGGYLMFLMGMVQMLFRNRLALPLILLTSALLVNQVFVSTPLYATMVFFLAGSLAGNKVLEESQAALTRGPSYQEELGTASTTMG